MFQLVPFLEGGDAIGNHARNLARALGREHAGYIVERARDDLTAEAVHWREARVQPADVLIYHVAHGSPMAAWFKEAQAVKVVDYHGITPPAIVRGWDAGLAVALDRARGELASLVGRVSLAVAHSTYMRRELDALGFPATAVLPLLVDPHHFETMPNPDLNARLRAGNRGHDLLFVGRIAPNKRIEDLIKTFAIYRRAWRDDARLYLVGRPDTTSYQAALTAFVARLGVGGIHFTGKVSGADLATFYRCADAFVSMSEHEGFGVPWLEAMSFGLPVIAYAAGALPETIGDGGILFREKSYEDVAALIDLVLSDTALAARLVKAGRARARQFAGERFDEEVQRLMGSI